MVQFNVGCGEKPARRIMDQDTLRQRVDHVSALKNLPLGVHRFYLVRPKGREHSSKLVRVCDTAVGIRGQKLYTLLSNAGHLESALWN